MMSLWINSKQRHNKYKAAEEAARQPMPILNCVTLIFISPLPFLYNKYILGKASGSPIILRPASADLQSFYLQHKPITEI